MAKNRPVVHTRVQRAGRKRDGNTCQICGSSDCVEGHHIIDHQFSGAAQIDNIITLCHKHHNDVHNGMIDILKI